MIFKGLHNLVSMLCSKFSLAHTPFHTPYLCPTGLLVVSMESQDCLHLSASYIMDLHDAHYTLPLPWLLFFFFLNTDLSLNVSSSKSPLLATPKKKKIRFVTPISILLQFLHSIFLVYSFICLLVVFSHGDVSAIRSGTLPVSINVVSAVPRIVSGTRQVLSEDALTE